MNLLKNKVNRMKNKNIKLIALAVITIAAAQPMAIQAGVWSSLSNSAGSLFASVWSGSVNSVQNHPYVAATAGIVGTLGAIGILSVVGHLYYENNQRKINSPLFFIACRNGSTKESTKKAIDDAVKNGADVNAKAWWDDWFRNMLLLRVGPRFDMDRSYTPLYTMAANYAWNPESSLQAIKSLFAHGAKINDIVGYRGNTALHVAAEKGYHEVAKLLLELGADPAIRNKAGKTAQELAEEPAISLQETKIKKETVDFFKAFEGGLDRFVNNPLIFEVEPWFKDELDDEESVVVQALTPEFFLRHLNRSGSEQLKTVYINFVKMDAVDALNKLIKTSDIKNITQILDEYTQQQFEQVRNNSSLKQSISFIKKNIPPIDPLHEQLLISNSIEQGEKLVMAKKGQVTDLTYTFK